MPNKVETKPEIQSVEQDGPLLRCYFCEANGVSCVGIVGSPNRFAVRKKNDGSGDSVVYNIGVPIRPCREGRSVPITLGELEDKRNLVSLAVVTESEMDMMRRLNEQMRVKRLGKK